MIALFGHRGPAGKQRPDRAVVIARSIIKSGLLRNDSHTPVRLMILGRKLRDGLVCMVWVGQTEPHGHGGQHAGLIGGLVIRLQTVYVAVLYRRAEGPMNFR